MGTKIFIIVLLSILLGFTCYKYYKLENKYNFILGKNKSFYEVTNYILKNDKNSVVQNFKNKYIILDKDSVLILKNKKIEYDFFGIEVTYKKDHNVKSIDFYKP